EAEESNRFRLRKLETSEKESILSMIKQVLEKDEDIVLAVVHGSFISEEHFRDIDVAIYVGKGVDYLSKKFSLEKKLEKETGIPVDVNVLNNAPAWFMNRVLGKGKLLVEKYPIYEKLYLLSLDQV
ncbi:MAG: nucleotidyltransferase domain-containing protein, partial [Nitrososphaerota archaeon]